MEVILIKFYQCLGIVGYNFINESNIKETVQELGNLSLTPGHYHSLVSDAANAVIDFIGQSEENYNAVCSLIVEYMNRGLNFTKDFDYATQNILYAILLIVKIPSDELDVLESSGNQIDPEDDSNITTINCVEDFETILKNPNIVRKVELWEIPDLTMSKDKKSGEYRVKAVLKKPENLTSVQLS